MAKGRGRPSKSGKRTKAGRLRAVGEQRVLGNDRAQAKSDLFGVDGWDAIGRAFVMGLLGEGAEAKQRLDTGRKYASLYRRFYARGYRCALDGSPRGSDLTIPSAEQDQRTIDDRDWLDEQTSRVVALGCGPYFDALVDHHNLSGDMGPSWLDRLLAEAMANRARVACGKPQIPFHELDWIIMAAALKGLDAIIPQPAQSRILCDRETRAA